MHFIKNIHSSLSKQTSKHINTTNNRCTLHMKCMFSRKIVYSDKKNYDYRRLVFAALSAYSNTNKLKKIKFIKWCNTYARVMLMGHTSLSFFFQCKHMPFSFNTFWCCWIIAIWKWEISPKCVINFLTAATDAVVFF